MYTNLQTGSELQDYTRKMNKVLLKALYRHLRKECLGWTKYKHKDIPDLQDELQNYLVWYHNIRPHMGLGLMTPNEHLKKCLVPDN